MVKLEQRQGAVFLGALRQLCKGRLLGIRHQGRLPRPAAPPRLHLSRGTDEQAKASLGAAGQPVELGPAGIPIVGAHVVGQRGQHGPILEPLPGPHKVELIIQHRDHGLSPGICASLTPL
ncbi:hypothetical protein D3C84_932680 [compost metagenome]